MKRLRLLLAASLLLVTLAIVPAMAGQMPGGITSTPPPPAESSATGEMPFGATPAIDPVTEFTLSLLQSLLALF